MAYRGICSFKALVHDVLRMSITERIAKFFKVITDFEAGMVSRWQSVEQTGHPDPMAKKEESRTVWGHG